MKPIYLQIYESIKEKIFSNIYESDHFLPSEREFAEEYSVERATVRRALEILAKEEIIIKIPGSGSKVKIIASNDFSMTQHNYNNIAFILSGEDVNKITQPFYSSIFHTFEMECRKHDYNLFYTNLKGDYIIPDVISNKMLKGIVWVSSISPNLLKQSKEFNIPSILISNTHPDYLSILADNVSGSSFAVQHLIDLGHKRIAYINGIETYVNAIERRIGYTRTLKQANISIDDSILEHGDWTYESGYQATLKLLERNNNITAIFVANDMMALGAQNAIISKGLSIPRDISVIGFDNIEQCKYSSPALSTIGVSTKMFARQMMNSLMNIIETNDNLPVKILIPTALNLRNSTGVCP